MKVYNKTETVEELKTLNLEWDYKTNEIYKQFVFESFKNALDFINQVAEIVEDLRQKGMSVLIITHYARILHYIKPNKVHVLKNGVIDQTGDSDLAYSIEKTGYEEENGNK